MLHYHTTPWGSPDHIRDLIPGVMEMVDTPSHGGIGVDAIFAEEHLSDACRKIGERERIGDIYWFEEDCDACAPMLEMLESSIHSDIFIACYKNTLTAEAAARFCKDNAIASCYRTLTHYRPEYMESRKKDAHA